MKRSSPLLPSKTSLADDCTRVLAQRIRQGEWSLALPGERRLAEILQVGRDTLRRSLTELTLQGLLEPCAHGRKRLIKSHLIAEERHQPTTLRIGMLSPHRLERMSQNMLTEVDHIRSILAKKAIDLDVFSPAWYDAPHPQKHLREFLQQEPCHAWLLYRSSLAIQQTFQETQAPCIIRGYPHDGIALPSVDIDWAAAANHAMGELWRKGHRHIGVIVPQDGLRGNIAALEGARAFTGADTTVREIIDYGNTDGLLQSLDIAFRSNNPPSAILTLRPRQALTFLTWFASAGRQIPRHCSLISLASETIFESIVPRISTYHIDPTNFSKRLAKQLEQLAKGSRLQQRSLLMMPDFIRGTSISSLTR